MIGLPPSLGAVHDTFALPLPGVAETPVGAAGADSVGAMLMNEATEGTPFEFRMNSM